MVILRCVAGTTAMYTSIHLAMNLFCCPHSVLTGFVFSQVSFVFHSGIIKTAFYVHFVVPIVLRFIVDVIFLFHCEWWFNSCPKIETEKHLSLWETVIMAIADEKFHLLYIMPLSLQKAISCSLLVKFSASLMLLSFFSMLLSPDGFIWCC